MLTEKQINSWVEAYVRAWRSYEVADIEALFAPDGESHEWPYETHWIGRDAIVQGWQDRQAWQEGGWDFTWEILLINGDTAAVKGTGTYQELGTFLNLMVVTLDDAGRATSLRLWNNEI
jgi:ketosteroid isomerase-like protein